jgi:cytochrome bd-type quinol oxidase subunit 2
MPWLTYIRTIFSLLGIYALVAITFMCVLFGLLNQSTTTPLDERLTIENQLAPYTVTALILIYFAIKPMMYRQNKKHWLTITLMILALFYTLPWQYHQLIKQIEIDQEIQKIGPFIVSIIITLWIVIEELISKLTEHNKT